MQVLNSYINTLISIIFNYEKIFKIIINHAANYCMYGK